MNMPSHATDRRDATNDTPEPPGAAPVQGRGPSSSSVPLLVKQESMTSVVSDMTMMTYSKEKTEMLMEEFFKRASQGPKDLKNMPDEERAELLAEVREDLEAEFRRTKWEEKEAKRRVEENKERFQRWMAKQESEEQEEGEEKKEEKKIERSERRGRSERGDLLTRFRALKQSESVRQDRERLAGQRGIKKTSSQPQVSSPAGEGDKEKLPGFQEIKFGAKGKRPSGGIQLGTTVFEELRDEPREARTGGLVQSFSSTGTAKVANTSRHWSGRDLASSFSSFFSHGSGDEEREGIAGGRRVRASKLLAKDDVQTSKFQGNENRKDIHRKAKSSDNSSDIEQFIALKLQVANQQATIDTLSSRLHNIELAHRQSGNQLGSRVDQTRMRRLEEENQRLASELRDCHEREGRMRYELEMQQEDRIQDLESENAALRRQLALPLRMGKTYEKRLSMDTASSTDSSSAPHTI